MISIDVALLSQFIHKSRQIYWEGIMRIFAYIKNFPENWLLCKKHSHIHIFHTQILDILEIEIKGSDYWLSNIPLVEI